MVFSFLEVSEAQLSPLDPSAKDSCRDQITQESHARLLRNNQTGRQEALITSASFQGSPL